MSEGKKLYSIIHNRCPHCHQGDFFVTNNPYDLSKFDKMNLECNVCGESFIREPGFYYGSMYASYGLTILLGMIMFCITVLILDTSVLTFLISFSVSAILLMPLIYREARLIWINIFVNYKKPDSPKKSL